ELGEKGEDVAGYARHTSSDRAVQPAVDVDALARDVARLGRAEERRQERHVGRVAEIAERDVARELGLALRRWMHALGDLLVLERRQEIGAPGDHERSRALRGQHLSDLAPQPDAGARDDGDLAAQLEVHRDLRRSSSRLPTTPLGRKMMNRTSNTP